MGAFNGSGTFVRTYNWTTDAANNIDILPDRMDTEDNGFATGLSTCITKDGQTTVTADIPFGNHKLTGVAAGTARTHAAVVSQIQDGAVLWGGTAGGTANAQTITLSPAITAYAAGQKFRFVSVGTNTGATTLNANGVGAKNITKNGTTALTGAELPSGAVVEVVYDGIQFQLINVTLMAVGDAYSFLQNMALAVSVGSNALTVAIKGKDGNDPSTTNPVIIPFRSATITSGDYDTLTLTAAISFTVSSGSTLGGANGVCSKFWVVLFNDAGTARLGIINCRSSDGMTIYALSACNVASSTAEGGAGAADSANVFYTGTAVSSKAFRVLGYMQYDTALATAGTYSAAPDRVCLAGHDTRLPGAIVQISRAQSSAAAGGSTTIPYDDTIPQNTEGNAWSAMDCLIRPICGAHVLRARASANIYRATGGSTTILALFQDSGANALAASAATTDNGTGNAIMASVIDFEMIAATTSDTTFKLRYGATSGNSAVNGDTGASRKLGGVNNSWHEVTEIAC